MYNDSELDKVFLPYNKILYKLKLLNIKTKTGNEITHKDLRKAITIMEKKHKSCRWKFQRPKKNKNYILIEGFYWLVYVYFNNDKKLIDADIDFFEERIKLYEELLKLDHKTLFENNININQLLTYFNKKESTIQKAIIKMLKINSNYKYKTDTESFITKDGLEWICKNCFKDKYLKLLEDYKMELTEKYMQAGYIYDNFSKIL